MSTWNLVYGEWNPEEQPLREALCVLGNGFFATRGAAEETRAGGRHYPGTYIAGAYNRLTTDIAGRTVKNEDLVNWPNWLFITFRHEAGNWFHIDDVEVLEFQQDLDMKRGVLERRFRFRDETGRTSLIHARRIVSMRRPHIAAIDWTLTAVDWSGPIVIRSEIDGNVSNCGVKRYRDLNGDHIEVLEAGNDGKEIIWLTSRTTQSLLRVAHAVRHRLDAEERQPTSRQAIIERDRAAHEFSLLAARGRSIRLEKLAAIYTHRDWAISEPADEARRTAQLASDFATLFHEHNLEWDRLWEFGDMELDGPEDAQRILRLHFFHLLQTVSLYTVELDVGVPARGWHGEAYRGHIFWDELFIFPYLTLRIPELTRTLLMYRYRRLEEARRAAAEAGYAGAMFPWQSGSSGREETQELHLNPKSGRWNPDPTHLQRHINAAIAYNVWLYYQATKDEEFLALYGTEMILEVARFWASVAVFNEKRGRYDIRGIVGPDEYHTAYPDAERPGLDNNAYTNVMAAWTIDCAQRVLDCLPSTVSRRMRQNLDITDDELERWNEVKRKLFIPFHDGGIISQFEGYEQLKEFDWDGYRKKYEDIQRLDRILEAEDESTNRYKASKQADVLMLFYLFSSEELCRIFDQLGYEFDAGSIPRNIEYYEARTSHGSTLSRVVHAWVMARCNREASWSFFHEALRSDVDDIQGGTTSEGIHLGAMAGTVDLVQRCYAGVELRDDVLWLNPRLPEPLADVRLSFRYRGHSLALRVTQDEVTIESRHGGPAPIQIGLCGEVFELAKGDKRTCSMQPGEAKHDKRR